jgi:hypothetical protein
MTLAEKNEKGGSYPPFYLESPIFVGIGYSNFLASHHGKNSGMSVETLPGNSAGLFSRKDCTPSAASADFPVK